MPGEQTIHLYCLCWNDARMLPYFFQHYDEIVDRYFVFDNGSTDGSISMLETRRNVELAHFEVLGDSFVAEEQRLSDTIWRRSSADWVIITDIDEHLYHPNLAGYLRQCTQDNITAIRSIGYEMVSETFPQRGQPLCQAVTQGVRSAGHDRLCIFNPNAVVSTNFGPGRHVAHPEGQVVWPNRPEVLLLHYKQLGLEYLVTRSIELRKGLRNRDLVEGWGAQYTWSQDTIAENWQKLLAASDSVPGLGNLKHLDPSQYFEEESVVGISGLVESDWYLSTYPDVQSAGADPLSHFCIHGWREGRKPNFYFDTEWYSAKYSQMCATARNPLYDYIVRGEREGAWPSRFFNTAWYRDHHVLAQDESPLRHYLMRRRSGVVSPLPEFDVAAYCRRHPEILTQKQDPFESHCKGQDLDLDCGTGGSKRSPRERRD